MTSDEPVRQDVRRTWETSGMRRDLLVAVTKATRWNLPGSPRAQVMLRELRHEAGIPEPTLLVMLGCSHSAFRKWLSGERTPSGAAQRCIWLLYRLHLGTAPRDLSEWFLWTLAPRAQ